MKGTSRRIWSSLAKILGVGLPAIASMSVSLPGPGGRKERRPALSRLLEATLHLGRVQESLEDKDYVKAREQLEIADTLMSDLVPHTADYESLSALKSGMWEEVTRSTKPEVNQAISQKVTKARRVKVVGAKKIK